MGCGGMPGLCDFLAAVKNTRSHDDFAPGVAHPIVLVLDNYGAVSHRFSDANYTVSPPLDLVLKVLRGRGKS